jgi:hypothetical protein
MGGLGNQLFQIFAIIAYSIQHNEPFIFPYTETIFGDPVRPSYWNSMLVYLKKYTNYDGLIPTEKLESFPIVNGEHGYHPIPTIYSVNYSFCGYFQSYRYFEDTYSQIYKLLRIEELKSNLELKPVDPQPSVTISMHFRLGDYVHKQCFHPVIPVIYYRRSLEHIIQQYPIATTSRVFVFFEREDIEYITHSIEELRVHFPKVAFSFIEEQCDWKQMLLMGKCNHHIIANSTFSWWGAKLATDTIGNLSNKTVCYPSVWHGHLLDYIDTSELFPPSWTKIQIQPEEMDMSHCRCAELISQGLMYMI